jgi:multiple sugar transport system permease protein
VSRAGPGRIGGAAKRRALAALTGLALVALAVAALAPLLWMLSLSLMPTGEATSVPPRLLPSRITFEHYVTLFARLPLARAFANSLLLASAATALGLASNTLAGYAFAKLRFPGRDRLARALLAALVIPGQVAMLPLFLMVKELGLVNTYAGVLVPSLASIFGIFLVRQYVAGIPDALLDAARLDGAGELRVFTAVVLPLCKPVLVTLATFTFLGAWNDFLWPLVVLGDERLQPLPVVLASLLGEHAQDVELLMAGSLLTVLPVVVLFVALQRYYLQGILTGGLRG